MSRAWGDLSVVEYSPSQGAFHVESVKEMVQNNLRVFFGESVNDYICIGIFEDEDELQTFLDRVYEIREQK